MCGEGKKRQKHVASEENPCANSTKNHVGIAENRKYKIRQSKNGVNKVYIRVNQVYIRVNQVYIRVNQVYIRTIRGIKVYRQSKMGKSSI